MDKIKELNKAAHYILNHKNDKDFLQKAERKIIDTYCKVKEL